MTSLLLLHGLTFDHHQWDPLRRLLDLAAIAARDITYHFITSHEPPKPYVNWMTALVPAHRTTVVPGDSHFPHLADPESVARLILP
jgi:pimeloyl-ACP methyl ester carboxylesterase